MLKTAAVLAAGFVFFALAAPSEPSVTPAGASPATAGADRFWPQWRGPLMNGVAPHGSPPIEWNETKNVAWKVEIPGKGSATPVVWGDRIFLLSAVPAGKPAAPPAAPEAAGAQRGRGNIQPDQPQKFTLLAFRRSDGKILWQRVAREELPHEGTQPNNTWASGSAVTDGEMVYAYFGSSGLYAYDMEGHPKWEKDLGDMTIKLGFGEGSSPALHGDRLIILWDHEGKSFIAAIDKKTGKEIWRTDRDEKTSWSTPLVVEHAGKVQVITSATGRVRSYDFGTGKLLWETPGMTDNAIPTPVSGDGIAFLTSGFRGNALLAIRLAAAQGDVSSSDAIVWRYDRDTPYVPSPLLYGNELYVLKSNNGILTAFNARTGDRLYEQVRIEAVPNVYASPVGAADRVYLVGREGGPAVIARGPEFKLLAANRLDDGFDASPAVVDNELYLRGKKFLYRISEK
jgi:outer membrane protein assembly factor BamB